MGEASDDRTTNAAPRPRERPWVLALWPGGSAERDLPANGSILIGRASDCDLVIAHRSVSRHHVRLHVGKPMCIEDLGGVNGTTLAGRRIAAGARAPLRAGESVLVGEVALLVQEAAANGPPPPDPLVADDDAMKRVVALVDLLATSDSPILLLGETGVGKTTLAERAHGRSARAAVPLVRANAAALQHAQAEHELVGDAATPGALVRAHRGTLVLEGLGDLTPALQGRLLRLIETREVVPLGSAGAQSVDVRVVATADPDLAARVEAGTFRRELYYRLAAACVVVPPLRKRTRDIAPLAHAFLARARAQAGRATLRLGANVVYALERHEWPGNVRELDNVMQTAAVLGDGDAVDLACVETLLASRASDRTRPGARALAKDLAEAERARIVEALGQCGGNQTRAAELLGISRRTLVARLTEYGLPRPLKAKR